VADQEAQAVRDRAALSLTLIVVSGAPGTGKSTIARALGADLRLCIWSSTRLSLPRGSPR
jgi:MoxR-like ATPase